jgi:hypothetical protein
MSAKARDAIQQFERIQVISIQLTNSAPDFPIRHMGEKGSSNTLDEDVCDARNLMSLSACERSAHLIESQEVKSS